MRAGGVLKTLGNPLAKRSAFSRSRANLFGKTFLVRTIVRSDSAISAKLGLDKPSARGSGCCAKTNPGSKNAMSEIDESLIDMECFEGRLLTELTKLTHPEHSSSNATYQPKSRRWDFRAGIKPANFGGMSGLCQQR